MTPWDVVLLNAALYLLFALAILTWASQFMGPEWLRHVWRQAREQRERSDDDRDFVKDRFKPPGSGPGSLA